MTATDELRRMLDERGVEWHCVDMRTGEERSNITEWNVPNAGWVEATELGGHLTYSWHMGEKPTPAQAIESTLGRGTCRITDNGPWGYPYVCSACGASFDADVNNGEFNYCPNCGREVVGA